jgi:hypothetical protein
MASEKIKQEQDVEARLLYLTKIRDRLAGSLLGYPASVVADVVYIPDILVPRRVFNAALDEINEMINEKQKEFDNL